MSKVRSPCTVCSTTIGICGLIAAPSCRRLRAVVGASRQPGAVVAQACTCMPARAMHKTVRVTATEATNRDRRRQAVLAFLLGRRRCNSDGFEHSAEALNVFGCGLTQEQRGLSEAAKATA